MGLATAAPTRTQAVAYVRVSSDEQARSGLGIEAQRKRCLAMATVKGWPEPVVFADEGISGTKGASGRPGLQALLRAVEERRVDVVVVNSLDRLGRRTRLVLDLVDELSRAGVNLVSCKESLDTTTPQGQFVLTMFAALAQLERDLIAQRTSAALQELDRRGGRAGRLPYGYLRVGEGEMVINGNQAQVVRLIFALRRRGFTLRAIAARLDLDQVPCPRGGEEWQHSAVREILGHEEAYRGGLRGESALRWPVILEAQEEEAGMDERGHARSE